MKFTDEKFVLFRKDDWKLSCNHVIAMEAQYTGMEALLDENRKTVVHVRNDSDTSSDKAKMDAWSWRTWGWVVLNIWDSSIKYGQ
jgi:hypothetical protein